MSMSLIEVLREGGCYWEKRLSSPGHSFAVPTGTPFRIAVEGPKSHVYVGGKCQEGYYLLEDGPHAGSRFSSANEAVNTVREPSTNAFLYIQFFVSKRWTDADDLRRSDQTRCDEIEDEAIALALEVLKSKIRQSGAGRLDRPQRLRMAAELVASDPEYLEHAARRVAWKNEVASFDFEELTALHRSRTKKASSQQAEF